MTANIAQLKESEPANTGLIGTFFSSNRSQAQAKSHKQGYCPACDELLLPQSNFCGDCGSPAGQHSETAHSIGTAQPHTHGVQHAEIPAFAQVSPQMKKAIPPEIKKEYGNITTLLARERFFLIAHYLLFLSANLFGFWVSIKAYNGLYADEVTRVVIALFPLFFINTVALGCLWTIKGTKAEIARLKERLTYLHYQIEYINL